MIIREMVIDVMNTGNTTKKDIIITISCYVGSVALFFISPYILSFIFNYDEIGMLVLWLIIVVPLILLISSFIIGFNKSWLWRIFPIFYFAFSVIYMIYLEITSYSDIKDIKINEFPVGSILLYAILYTIPSIIGLLIGYFRHGYKK